MSALPGLYVHNVVAPVVAIRVLRFFRVRTAHLLLGFFVCSAQKDKRLDGFLMFRMASQ